MSKKRTFFFSFLFFVCGIIAFVLVLVPQNLHFNTLFGEFKAIKTQKIKTLTRADLANLPNLELGDLVFRLGDEFDSVLISQVSDFKYSHIAIVVNLEPITLLHATTSGESGGENAVILSEFDEFLSHARSLGVARINFLTQTQKSRLVQNLKAKLGEKFILAKSTEPNLYCTTLIEREIFKIYPNFTPKYTQINAPIFNGLYLTPKAFWESRNIKIIYEMIDK